MYWGYNQNHLVILDNGHIFIGVNAKNKKQLIVEDIRNKNSPEIIAQYEYPIFSLLANEAQNILWVGNQKNIFQYTLGPNNGWKIQAKYSDLGIHWVQCLSRFGNLLFAGGNNGARVINTADKKVILNKIRISICTVHSIQICGVSPSETYLTAAGWICASVGSDIYDISKLQQLTFAQKIFSKPELHINSIRHQFNNNSTIKELSFDNKISKVNKPSHEKR
jgi:hypothetical protein